MAVKVTHETADAPATKIDNIKNIYAIVNEAAKQSMGAPIEVIDASSLVTLGKEIFDAGKVDAFTRVLVQRIARTIISYRAYKSPYDVLALSDFEYGAFVQKLEIEMPEAHSDDSIDLEDGLSVDMYIVAKPKFQQKLFSKVGSREYHITIQRKWLKMAFDSPERMGAAISAIFGKVRNKIELDDANTGRLTVSNYIANIADTSREIKLVTMYNAATGKNVPTGAGAMFDESFMRYAIGRMNYLSSLITDIATKYNDGTIDRFTPSEYQRFFVEAEFQAMLETQVQYAAFHDRYVTKMANRVIPFWQTPNSPRDIEITAETNTGAVNKTVNNVVAFLFDRDALGTYKHDEDTLTTPVNARGRYYNVYWFLEKMWFNDLSENGVVFTLN
ncbi:MAG TPA: hypothetical protein DEB74_05990 [Lachnospiraceae bacterium]|nr:hypothetical protein [Lachnospiraceae bacterium]